MHKGQTRRDAARVWERLFLGGLADAERLAGGNPHHITTVISLSEIAVHSKRPDVSYVHIPIEDDAPVPIRDFYSVMDAIRRGIRWGRVLVQCGAGVSRAPSLTAAWMATVGYKNIDAALEDIRKVRSYIAPSDTLLESLRRHLQ
jgi:protein-tyrosine phosphatase